MHTVRLRDLRRAGAGRSGQSGQHLPGLRPEQESPGLDGAGRRRSLRHRHRRPGLLWRRMLPAGPVLRRRRVHGLRLRDRRRRRHRGRRRSTGQRLPDLRPEPRAVRLVAGPGRESLRRRRHRGVLRRRLLPGGASAACSMPAASASARSGRTPFARTWPTRTTPARSANRRSTPSAGRSVEDGEACGVNGDGTCCSAVAATRASVATRNRSAVSAAARSATWQPAKFEVNLENECEWCDPDLDPFAWSPRSDEPCGENGELVCCTGICCPDGPVLLLARGVRTVRLLHRRCSLRRRRAQPGRCSAKPATRTSRPSGHPGSTRTARLPASSTAPIRLRHAQPAQRVRALRRQHQRHRPGRPRIPTRAAAPIRTSSAARASAAPRERAARAPASARPAERTSATVATSAAASLRTASETRRPSARSAT